MSKPIDKAVCEFMLVVAQLKDISAKGSYTNAEMQKARKGALRAVRFFLDPYLEHMPEKRHY